jgi:hypothetical protein
MGDERGWHKIDTANKGTWGIWRRVSGMGESFYTAERSPLIPQHNGGRQSIETMLAMRGLTRDFIQVYP